MHPDDDSYDALDDACRPDCHNRMGRASDEKMYAAVIKMAADISWYKRIAYVCWGLTGFAMLYVIMPAAKAIHNDIDEHTAAIARNTIDIAGLKSSQQRRIDRTEDDHRNCHQITRGYVDSRNR